MPYFSLNGFDTNNNNNSKENIIFVFGVVSFQFYWLIFELFFSWIFIFFFYSSYLSRENNLHVIAKNLFAFCNGINFRSLGNFAFFVWIYYVHYIIATNDIISISSFLFFFFCCLEWVSYWFVYSILIHKKGKNDFESILYTINNMTEYKIANDPILAIKKAYVVCSIYSFSCLENVYEQWAQRKEIESGISFDSHQPLNQTTYKHFNSSYEHLMKRL